MEEKVIREFQVIETEEGYRIEMKGDKALLRQMLFGGGRREFRGFRGFRPPVPPIPPEPPFPGEHFARHRHEHHGEHEHHGFGRRGRHMGGRWQSRGEYDLGPWWDEDFIDDAESDESAEA